MEAEDYREFQLTLLTNPEAGRIVPKSGGLSKMRWDGSRARLARRNPGHLLLDVGEDQGLPAVPVSKERAKRPHRGPVENTTAIDI